MKKIVSLISLCLFLTSLQASISSSFTYRQGNRSFVSRGCNTLCSYSNALQTEPTFFYEKEVVHGDITSSTLQDSNTRTYSKRDQRILCEILYDADISFANDNDSIQTNFSNRKRKKTEKKVKSRKSTNPKRSLSESQRTDIQCSSKKKHYLCS